MKSCFLDGHLLGIYMYLYKMFSWKIIDQFFLGLSPDNPIVSLFEYMPLGCMGVLMYVHVCGLVHMNCRSGEINYLYGYRYKCMYIYILKNQINFLLLFLVQLAEICC